MQAPLSEVVVDPLSWRGVHAGRAPDPPVDGGERIGVRGPSVIGLRSPGAVVIAVGLTALGASFEGLVLGALTRAVWIGFVAGVGLAALLVRRRSIFIAVVQPPLVLLAVVFISLRLLFAKRRSITLIKDQGGRYLLDHADRTMVAVSICLGRIFAQLLPRPGKAPVPPRLRP